MELALPVTCSVVDSSGDGLSYHPRAARFASSKPSWNRTVPDGGGGGAAFDTVTVTAADVVRLPAASRAMAVSVCGPLTAVVVFQDTEYGAAVVSSAPRLTPSSLNWTPTTPTLSDAVAEMVTVEPETVAPAVGALMATVGGAVSAGVPPLPGRLT